MTAGSNWPSMNEMESSAEGSEEAQPRFRINPFRRAAKWIARRRN